MKKYTVIFFSIILTCSTLICSAAPGDTLRDKLPIVSGGIKLQANLSNLWAHNVPGNIHTTPHVSGDIGGFIDFNVSKHFLIQFNLLATAEHCIVKGNGTSVPLYAIGMEIPVYLMGRFGNPNKGYVHFGGGPYTEFILWGLIKRDGKAFNPYHHIVGTDDTTGEDILALSDNHSGLAIFVGYEFPFGLQINASYQYSFSDIFAFEHHEGMSLHPQKARFGLAWRFGRTTKKKKKEPIFIPVP